MIPSKVTKRMCGLMAACVAAAIGASATGAVRKDNFNDNVTAAIWTPFNEGTTKYKEQSHRLCFRSTSDTNGKRYAGYESNGWTYRGQNNATFKFDYKVDVIGLTGSEHAAVGVYTVEPDEASALEVRVIQKATGRFVELELFVDNDSVLKRTAPVDNATGSVEVTYTKATDVMVVKVDGEVKITVDELNGDYGPFDLDVQLFGMSSKTSFGYANVWLDNFNLNGSIDT